MSALFAERMLAALENKLKVHGFDVTVKWVEQTNTSFNVTTEKYQNETPTQKTVKALSAEVESKGKTVVESVRTYYVSSTGLTDLHKKRSVSVVDDGEEFAVSKVHPVRIGSTVVLYKLPV